MTEPANKYCIECENLRLKLSAISNQLDAADERIREFITQVQNLEDEIRNLSSKLDRRGQHY